MARVKEKKRPINAFFRRVGLTFIALAIIFCSTVVLYVFSSMIGFSCPFKDLLQFSCPGCGMTSAAVDMFLLDFESAFNHNPSVFVLTAWVIITAVRYLLKGNFKRIMSFWWCVLGFLPIVLIWAIRVFLV